MASRVCEACSAAVPEKAQFCPRCGRAMNAPAPAGGKPGKVPAPWPMAGILFLAALILGPAALILGFVTGYPILLYTGIGVSVCAVLVLFLGDLLF